MTLRTVGVVGLGYIGLPLALCFCEKGYRVVGVDVNEEKVAKLSLGLTDVCEAYEGAPLQLLLQRYLACGAFVPTTRVAVAAWEGCAYIVTVGVPVRPDGHLNEEPLLNAMIQLGRVIKPNDLVIVRSTLMPGTMEKKVIPMLHQISRMRPGIDFHVAYAAERVAEGRAMYEFQTMEIVLAGLTPKCADVARNLLSTLTSGSIHITNLRTAESTKVIENVQRDVNIALAQQVAHFANFHGIDAYELIRLANTHPRVQLLEPGIGVGGYCIPNAYHYLEASLPEQVTLPLFKLARTINKTTPQRMIRSLEDQLRMEGKNLWQCTVAILGLGMKDYSNDIRYSPALVYAELLLERGAKVQAFDPTVPLQLPYQTESLAACLNNADGVIVGAWQHAFENTNLQAALELCCSSVVIVDLKQQLRPFLREMVLPTNIMLAPLA